jgi:hypothetical protein
LDNRFRENKGSEQYMGRSLKRYKCPKCDRVSDGTGLAAHMAATGHHGDRIEVKDADAPEVLDARATFRRRKRAEKPVSGTSQELVPVNNPRLRLDDLHRIRAQALSFSNVVSMTIVDPEGGVWICERVQ